MTVSDVMTAVEAFAPIDLAEPWDRPGLQVGDPAAPVEAVVVALDPCPAAVQEAANQEAQLLITHHPLLLSPLLRLDLSEPTPSLLGDCIRKGVAVYASHTNLDRAEGGVNDALAQSLGLARVEALLPGEELFKLAVTVPVGYEARIRRALAQAGAGRIGNYRGCAFSTRGKGTFVPLAGATPFLGRVGQEEEVEEVRVEAVLGKSRIASVKKAVVSVHPYEEPALDLYPLMGRTSEGGLGRVGDLPGPIPLAEWAKRVAGALGVKNVRYSGDGALSIRRVAVCGGSGASAWRDAERAGAQVLVTGDVKYHTARDAWARGIALLDAGHWGTEQVAVDLLADIVGQWAARSGVRLRVELWREPEPFEVVAG